MELNQAQESGTVEGAAAPERPPVSPLVGTVADVAAQVSYSHWGAVPWALASKSILAKAALPREPGGPVRGWVAGTDWRDKKTEIALYAVAESVPTNATANQLAAARRRSTAVRVCDDCGARTQQPLSLSSDGAHRCVMCQRIARIRRLQAELRAERGALALWAQQLLAAPLTAVVWVEVLEAPLTAAGNRRPPLAARVHAVDGAGRRLLDVLVKLAGPRTQGAPAAAVPAEQGAQALQGALAGRTVVCWQPDALAPVTERLAALGHPVRVASRSTVVSVAGQTAHWRGELDPANGQLLQSWAPGSADRLWLQLADIANDVDAIERTGSGMEVGHGDA